jgi:UDP-glucose 4-epimerase
MKKKIALVTGGAGFIGSHVVDLLLEKKFKVIVIDNLSGGHKNNIQTHLKKKNFKFLKKDITNLKKNDLKIKKLDFIFHFAGKGDIVPSILYPQDYFFANLLGTINILELARNLKAKKFLYAASSSCYGLAKTPTKETDKLDPLYPYALSKLMGESAVMHWSKLYNLPAISIRIFNAYGPRVKTTGAYGAVFGVFFKQKLSKKPFTLVGDGKQRRDFLHVKDVANAFYLAAIKKTKNKIFNLGSGRPKSIKSLINILGGSYVKIPKRPGEPNYTWANINRIKRDLNWRPKIDFRKGVNEMLQDINHWKNAPLWNVKKIKVATKDWFKYMSKYKK